MGVWTSFKSSYQAQGVFTGDMNYHEKGPKAAFRAANPRAAVPREGFAHALKRGIGDMVLESGNPGMITGPNGSRVSYGGSLLSRGGWRDITNKVVPTGSGGMHQIGARRTIPGMLFKGLTKSFGTATFLYTASTEGLLPAARDAAVVGSIWGAGKWGLARLGMGIPGVAAAAAIIGGGFAAREALVAGRQYGRDVRKASFGNAHNDMYGSAATMRQASLMAIQGSKINGRSALGSEASLLHQ